MVWGGRGKIENEFFFSPSEGLLKINFSRESPFEIDLFLQNMAEGPPIFLLIHPPPPDS